MVSGLGNKLPYGTLPRLLLAWVCTEAVRTQSPELVLGDSLAEWHAETGSLQHQRRHHWRADATAESDAPVVWLHGLAHLRGASGGEATMNAPIARATEFWWSESQPDARSLWDSKVELGQDFFNEIIRHPVPLDMHTLKSLSRSPTAALTSTCGSPIGRSDSSARFVSRGGSSTSSSAPPRPRANETRTVDAFRTDCLRELKKIKERLAGPALQDG